MKAEGDGKRRPDHGHSPFVFRTMVTKMRINSSDSLSSAAVSGVSWMPDSVSISSQYAVSSSSLQGRLDLRDELGIRPRATRLTIVRANGCSTSQHLAANHLRFATTSG